MKKKIASALILFVFSLGLVLGALSPTALAVDDEPELDGVIRAAMTVNLESGQTTYELDADKELFPGPTVKLMCAVVAYERLSERLDETVTFTDDMVYGGGFFLRGDSVPIVDIFESLLIRGTNDAAAALATLACGSDKAMVEAMNEKAAELGMSSTTYANVYGLHSASAKTTVRDTMRLAECFYNIRPLCEMASAPSATISLSGEETTIYNRSAFASTYYNTKYRRTDVESYLSGSTAESGACLVCGGRENGLTYITVVMGALADEKSEPNVYTAAGELVDYSYDNFGYVKVLDEGRVFDELPVELSHVSDHVTVCSEDSLSIFCKNGTNTDLRVTFEHTLDLESLTAPIKAGERVGTLTVRFDGETIAELGLYTANSLPKSSLLEFFDTAGAILGNPIVIILLSLSALALLATPFISAIRASHYEE